MRHGVSTKNLGSGKGYRKRLLRMLANSLVSEGKYVTHLAKAKASKSFVDKMVTTAKSHMTAAQTAKHIVYRRLAAKFGLTGKNIRRLMDEIAPRYVERNGGCVRLLHMGFDTASSPLAMISFV